MIAVGDASCSRTLKVSLQPKMPSVLQYHVSVHAVMMLYPFLQAAIMRLSRRSQIAWKSSVTT